MIKTKNILFATIPMLFAANIMATEVNEYTLGGIKSLMNENPEVIASVSEAVMVKDNVFSMGINDNNMYLMPTASGNKITTYSKNAAEFAEFSAKWTPVLEQYGLVPTKTFYDEKIRFGYIEYSSENGMVIRDFIAEKMDYDALSVASIDAIKYQVGAALDKAGLKTIAVLDLNTSIFRPTFRQYYLTKSNEKPEREIMIRQLDLGYDDELDLVKDRLNIIRVDRGSQVFYIGARMNYKWKVGKDEKDMAEKISAYKKYLKENGHEFVNFRTRKLEKPANIGDATYTLVTDIYFFL